MRKLLLTGVSLVLCLFLLCGCNVSRMSTLPELSKPYAGLYECEKVTLGGEDFTDRFEYLRLELSYGGEFRLSYRGKEGGEGQYGGTYRMNAEGDAITFTGKTGLRSVSRTFPVKNGAILVELTFGRKLFYAEFKMP